MRLRCAPTALVRIPAAPLDGPAPGFAAAVELASPGLTDARALTAYRLRMAHRPAPYGLFAGVAVARFGAPVQASLGAPVPLFRPTAHWLAGLADQLLPVAGDTMRVRTEPAARRQGEHYVAGDTLVRGTPLVRAVLTLCRGGTGYGQLLDRLAGLAPRLSRERLAGLVAELTRAGLLGTDLPAPPGHPDPVGHLLDRLGPDQPAGLPAGPAGSRTEPAEPAQIRVELAGPAGIRVELAGIRAALAGLPAEPAALRAAQARLRAVHDRTPALAADLLFGPDLVLPPEVAREAERAAAVLWAWAPPAADPLAGYHRRLVDRFGPHQEVPLPLLIDPLHGIGLPSWQPPEPVLTERDGVLLELAGRDEVVLAAAPPQGAAGDPPESFELHALLLADSDRALAAGDFTLAVSPQGGLRPAGAAAARFARLRAGLAAPTVAPEDVELVLAGAPGRLAAVLADTGWTRRRIVLGGAGAAGELALADLTVLADRHRLHLLGPDGPVRPRCYTPLAPARLPALARLLLALGGDPGPARSGQWAWDWGAAATLPRLPRVRTGRCVLSPARWTAAGDAPDRVAVVVGDQWLPLDRTDPAHAAVLRHELRRPGAVLTELPGGERAYLGNRWLRGPAGPHNAELVFALHRAAPVPAPARSACPPAAAQLPGGEWVSARIGVPADRQPAVLARLYGHPLLTRGHFLRAADHLRLRLKTPWQQAIPALYEFVGTLRAANLAGELTLDTYRPEAARYGGTVPERLFHADSVHVLELLRAAGGAVPDPAELLLLAAPGAREFALALGQDRLPTGPRYAPRHRELRAALLARRPAGLPTAAARTALAVPTTPRIAADLLHLHANRLFGPDAEAEHLLFLLIDDLRSWPGGCRR